MVVPSESATRFERFSTGQVAPGERLDYWRDITKETFLGSSIYASTPDFLGDLWRWRIGDLLLTRARASRSTIERSPYQYNGDDRITLHLMHVGSSVQTQSSRSCEMKAGDISLAESSAPFQNISPGAHEMLAIEAPAALIREQVPEFDKAMSRNISNRVPAVRMLHEFVLSLWRQQAGSPLNSAWCTSVKNIYLDLLGLAIVESEQQPVPESAMLGRVKQLIEARLHDPSLRTATLAGELSVSPRTVQLAFASINTTPSAYIQERRMQRAAEYLVTAPNRSITDIAMELGYNECSYFSRCFRKRFAMTPIAYRMRS